MRTVTGQILSGGRPAYGTLYFIVPSAVYNYGSNASTMQRVYTARLDTRGSFSLDLPETNDPATYPTIWQYTVRRNLHGDGDLSQQQLAVLQGSTPQAFSPASVPWSNVINRPSIPSLQTYEGPASTTVRVNYNTAQEIAGTQVTVNGPGQALVTGVYDVRVDVPGTTGRAFVGGLLLDGTTQPPGLAIADGYTDEARMTIAQQWVVEFDTAGDHTLQLRAYRGSGSLGNDPEYIMQANQTKIVVVWITAA